MVCEMVVSGCGLGRSDCLRIVYENLWVTLAGAHALRITHGANGIFCTTATQVLERMEM